MPPRAELLEQLPRLAEIGLAVAPERERAAARTGVGVSVLVDVAKRTPGLGRLRVQRESLLERFRGFRDDAARRKPQFATG